MPSSLAPSMANPGVRRPADVTSDQFIAFENVSKHYGTGRSRVLAVENVSFVARQGEFISILGPSGCGKSTMMMMASGLVPRSSGTIRIGGSVVTKPYTDLGIVFQQDLLMDWRRVLANVLVQAEFRGLPWRRFEERARELLSLVGLDGFEQKYPYELSGGMRQRVAICRALVHDPRLLLMDEPFGALDALTRDQLNLDLQRIWQENQKTVLFVTHSISEAVFLSDRVFVMGPRPTRILETIDYRSAAAARFDGAGNRRVHTLRSPDYRAVLQNGRAENMTDPAAVVFGQPDVSEERFRLGRVGRYAYPVGVCIAVLLIWQFATRLLAIPAFLLPSPLQIAASLGANWPIIAANLWPTLIEIVLGYILSILIGVPLAVAIVFSPVAERILYAPMVATQAIPKVAIAPLFIVWMGYDITPKIWIAFLIAFFPIVIDTMVGLRSLAARHGQARPLDGGRGASSCF